MTRIYLNLQLGLIHFDNLNKVQYVKIYTNLIPWPPRQNMLVALM